MRAADFAVPDDREALRLRSIQLVGILVMSNEVELASDPFQRRLRLNEMQEAIQSAKPIIEAIAEGLAL